MEAKDINRHTALLHAVKGGHLGNVQLLLHHKANIEAKDKNGQTALLLAVKVGDLGMVKPLLDQGAKMDEKDNAGRTALDLAKDKYNQPLVNLLRVWKPSSK